jgi:TPR repeat protein
LKWYREAAKQSDADAQTNLGVMYRYGQGVSQDDAEAVKWWRMAAERGHARAQFNLGFMYAKGEGVPQDYISAHLWFSLAASLGNENAKQGQDLAASNITPDQLAEAQRMAREWMAKHQQ